MYMEKILYLNYYNLVEAADYHNNYKFKCYFFKNNNAT